MISIPVELLEQIGRRNLLLFVGEGINQGLLPSSASLAEELASRCDYPAEAPRILPYVADYYALKRGRQGLIQFLQDRLGATTHPPSSAHNLVAKLQPRVIVSTCYDQLLARALREEGIPYTSVVRNADVAYTDDKKLLLVWLWGVLDQPDSVVVTDDDRRLFLSARANLSDVLRGELARRTWLFLGFDASDQWFRDFYDSVSRNLDRQNRRAYFVGASLNDYMQAWWVGHNAEIIDADIEPFLEALNAAQAAHVQLAPTLASTPTKKSEEPLFDRPYKLLDFYEAKDAAIFFGRQREAQELSSLINAHRLVVLYGASGVGKTSLLLAGVVPRLERADPPYHAMYVRALDDPAQIIRSAIRRQLPSTLLPEDSTLIDFLAVATQAMGRTLVIVLDQFEEFFVRLGPQFRAAFIAELGAIYDARDVPVKVVFSLREDWLAAMGELEGRIPEIFLTRMRLLPLSRSQAEQAIIEPVERLHVRYESALVERLLNDLIGNVYTSVMPPQLQLVCSALYDGLEPNKRLITLTAYEQLGGARGVLQQYLNDELARLRATDRTLARGVLEELVTSQGTKAVKAENELALALDIPISNLLTTLDKLVRARLLRVVEREDGTIAYELAHEYLIREINLSADVQRRKQADELIKQEVKNWQRFRTLLPIDKLELINEVRDLLRLTDTAQELLLRSSLQAGYEVEYWIGRIVDSKQLIVILTEATSSKLIGVRGRAVNALMLVGETNSEIAHEVVQILSRLLIDMEWDIRDEVATALKRIVIVTPESATPQLLETLISLLRHTDWYIRARAAGTLRYMTRVNPGVSTSDRVIEFLVNLLFDSDWDIRYRAAEILGTIEIITPLITIPRAATALINQLANSEINICCQAISSLERVSVDNPIIAPQTIETLVHLLEYSDSFILGKVIGGLGHIVTYTGIASLTVITALVERLNDRNQDVRSYAVVALRRIISTDPKTSTTQLVVALCDWLTDSNLDLKLKLIDLFNHMSITNPKLFTSNTSLIIIEQMAELAKCHPSSVNLEAVLILINRITHPNQQDRSKTADMVTEVLTSSTNTTKNKIIEILMKVWRDRNVFKEYDILNEIKNITTSNVIDASRTINLLFHLLDCKDNTICSDAASILREIITNRPELITPETISTLIEHTNDNDTIVRSIIITILEELVIIEPKLATPEIVSIITEQLADIDKYNQEKSTNALSAVYAYHSLRFNRMDDLYIKLTNIVNDAERPAAARALFIIALSEPSYLEQIQNQLNSLLDKNDPYTHTTITHTIEMLQIAEFSHIAASNPNKRNRIASFLQKFKDNDYAWAAQITIRWMKQQGWILNTLHDLIT